MDFNWAINKTKLQQSILKLTENKKLNPAIEIDEATIKAEYIKRGGLTLESAPVAIQEAVKAKRKAK